MAINLKMIDFLISELIYYFKYRGMRKSMWHLDIKHFFCYYDCLYWSADGSSGFKAEEGRYHLYISLACPYANRVLIVRTLKGLQELLPYTVLYWVNEEKTWGFTDEVHSHLVCQGMHYIRTIRFSEVNYM